MPQTTRPPRPRARPGRRPCPSCSTKRTKSARCSRRRWGGWAASPPRSSCKSARAAPCRRPCSRSSNSSGNRDARALSETSPAKEPPMRMSSPWLRALRRLLAERLGQLSWTLAQLKQRLRQTLTELLGHFLTETVHETVAAAVAPGLPPPRPRLYAPAAAPRAGPWWAPPPDDAGWAEPDDAWQEPD